ncbi:MAG: hypothetical protein JNK15_20430, partial [Planctomycetes bacterium]|nr:hypothetical protein [Planctomycetota bacterium]
MSIQNRRVVSLLALAALTAALHAQTPIGFEETYALSADRAKAVATLIPGSDDFYYWHCRERLDARDFATVRKVLPAWIQQHGRNTRVVEIEHREVLLSHDGDSDRAFAWLRDKLGVAFSHTPQIPGAKSDLPTRLDPATIAAGKLTAQLLASHPNDLDAFTEDALPALASQTLTERQLRVLLNRLTRPDVANLPALVVRELEQKDSRGFGQLKAHGTLRLEQLEECARLRPALLQDSRFIAAFLTRLQPADDVTWQDDPTRRAAQLQVLWTFAQRLAPTFNSLKAHVLLHWLQHDLSQGAPDKERFLAYLRLPRRTGPVAEEHTRRFARNEEFVDLRTGYATELPAMNDDTALVRACLEHFFASEDSVDAYAEWLDANWMKGVLAETKLLLGQGDPERWYALLADPARLEAIKQRVELTFPPTMPTIVGADDAVTLQLDVKNVPTLLLKVFTIDAWRFHQEKQKPVDASIELDGVVANHEQTFTYGDAPVRRVRRTFDLPMLKEPGTYVVEFVGNGISSRAVVHKGALRIAERTTAAGQAFTVFTEAGEPAQDPVAWFGGREYRADARGEIVLPFSTEPGDKQLVLRAGRRSSVVPFTHRNEQYTLTGGIHVERESLVAGKQAAVVVRPRLRLHDRDLALSLLQQPVLTIVATDRDGLATTQEVRDVKLVDEREFVHEIAVPERLAAVQVSLRGVVKDLAGNDVPVQLGAASFPVNGIDATSETGAVQMLATPDGFVLEVRGKNGEVLAGRPCQLQFTHRDLREPIRATLQTDASGRVTLGTLSGIDQVRVQRAGSPEVSFGMRARALRLPAALHGREGDVLRVPYQGTAASPNQAEFSLLGHAHDHFSALAIADGFLELRGLTAGDYTLRDHRTGETVRVRITAGAAQGRWVVGRERLLATTPTQPLHVRSTAIAGDELRVTLANATPTTRVHVVATRHLPTFDPWTLAGHGGRGPAVFGSVVNESSYHAGRTLGDEYRYVLERRYAPKYAGNMLARPSLLLNPWALEDTTSDPNLQGGGGSQFGGRRGRGAAGGGPGSAGPGGRPGATGGSDAGSFASFDWLPAGAVWHGNLVPGTDGIVRVPVAALGDGQHVHVLALDGDQAILESLVRPETAVAPRTRTLAQALDGKAHFIEQKRIEFVAAGATTQLADARSAQVEIHDSLASVFRLFTTISQNQDLAKFAFVLEWPNKKPEEKAELYRQHACHELHFFLLKKDPQFFAAVVQPFLQQKLDKTFLDQWLLGFDLTAFTEPWAFAQLNLVERILLAQRLDEAGRGAVARSVREALELRPTDVERMGQLFDLALKSDELQNKTGSTDFYLGSLSGPGDKVPPAPTTAAPSAKPNAPAGPTTGGPGGGGGRAKGAERGESKNDLAEAEKAPAEERAKLKDSDAKELTEELRKSLDDREEEAGRRQQAQQLYRAVAKTKLLVEHNWFHRTMQASTAEVVTPNRFWADYATAPAGQPFVSSALVEATGSCLEMMLALAVLDLPFTPGKHEITADGDTRTLKAATPLLLVRKEVTPAERAEGGAPMLLGQNFFRLDDRFETVNGERRDRFVTGEFVVDVPYGCQVVVTNPTSTPRTA